MTILLQFLIAAHIMAYSNFLDLLSGSEVACATDTVPKWCALSHAEVALLCQAICGHDQETPFCQVLTCYFLVCLPLGSSTSYPNMMQDTKSLPRMYERLDGGTHCRIMEFHNPILADYYGLLVRSPLSVGQIVCDQHPLNLYQSGNLLCDRFVMCHPSQNAHNRIGHPRHGFMAPLFCHLIMRNTTM